MGMVALRCSSCGAALQPTVSGDLIQCDHCGTTQKVIDARGFVDQVVLQVQAFLRQALPMSVDSGQLANVDPIARHGLFLQSIRPRLDPDSREIRFQTMNLLSHPLVGLPYSRQSPPSGMLDPRQTFVLQAKFQAVSSIPVDAESKTFVAEAQGLAVTCGSLLTNIAFLAGEKPERYHFMARNFAEAAKSLRDFPNLRPISDRLAALSTLCEGLDFLQSGKTSQALEKLTAAQSQLELCVPPTGIDFQLASTLHGLDQDLSLARASTSLASALSLASREDGAAQMVRVRAMVHQIDMARVWVGPDWQSMGRVNRAEPILTMFHEMRRAQSGGASVQVVGVEGGLFVPFWCVQVPYSFQTGALWKAKGVAVAETMLVAASFPLENACQTMTGVASVVTDVFGARSQASFRDRVTGRETAISGGEYVRRWVDSAQPSALGGRPAVPPLSTSEDAASLVNLYLRAARARDRAVDEKLRLSSPKVTGLVYVPCYPELGARGVIPGLGALSPHSVGRIDLLSSLAWPP